MLFIRRLIAYWLDCVMLGACLIGAQFLLYTANSGYPFQAFDTGWKIELWVLGTMSLPIWLYFVGCEFKYKQTLGKRICNLKVTNSSGSAISLSQAIGRTAIKLFPWEVTHLILLIPDPWMWTETPSHAYLIYIPNVLLVLYVAVLGLTKGRLSLHDRLFRTHVH